MNSIAPLVLQSRVLPPPSQINLMLTSNLPNANYTFFRRPGLPSSTCSFVKASNFTPKIKYSAPVFHGLRFVEPRYRPIVKRWTVSCFRNDELSYSEGQPEFPGEEILGENSQTSEVGQSSVPNRDLISRIAEVADLILRVTGKRWTVPWTGHTIIQVTLLWVVSFWFVGSWMTPFTAHLVGYSKESLTFRGQALFSLLTDVTEGLAGILILHRCLSRFRPLESDWFRFSLRGKWLFDVILGCSLFPLVNRLSQLNLNLLPVLPSTPVTLSSVEQSIMARDPVAMGLYALVLVVCAPLWEEIVFRGFLLPSLTKYMPVWCAILMSSVAFALAHFNVHRTLPLIFLGVVMGVIYARSRNLLPSILLHSLWNGFVFIDLMK